MFKTLSVLMRGAQAQAEERLRDANALPLIEQHIREAEASLRAAKVTLASLIQRRRSEDHMITALEKEIHALTARAQAALDDGKTALAEDAAEAIARLENEHHSRSETRDGLQMRIDKLQFSIERGHRRLIELRQGALAARAAKQEHAAQRRLRHTLSGRSSADEAESLIAEVLRKDDPLEQSQILEEIDANLGASGVTDRLAAAGYGPATKITSAAVLARLKTRPAQ